MFIETISRAKEELELGNDLELVEIIESTITGTPRKEGAFMFVDKNAESFGTVGGGKVEYLSTLNARDLLLKKEDGEKEYNLSQQAAENIGMVCGGDCKMKFTYLTNDKKSYDILDVLKEKNKNKNTVYIFGGGHVSLELAKVLDYLSFDCVVWDDREEFANEERFKEVKNIKQTIVSPYEGINDKVKITKNDFVVVMTRGHACDYEVEKQALKTEAAYIGVIGSSNKCNVICDKLLKDGYSEEEIKRVCAPVGLQIAAETPEEIAIAIAAEIVLFRSYIEKRNKVMRENSLVNIYKDHLPKSTT